MKSFLLLSFLCLSTLCLGQNFLSWRYSDRYFSVQMGTGHSMYLGELNSSYTVQNIPSNANIAVEARLLSKLAARLEGSYYKLNAGDYNASSGSFERQRNLSFTSLNFEASLLSVWYLKQYGGDFHSRWPIDPYLTLGIGISSYNPTAKFNGDTFELRPLQTENVSYGNNTLIIPAGAGVKIKINDFINLMLEVSYRYTFTDYLDDVSTLYPTVSEDNIRSLLINRKNEIGVVNPSAYQQLVPGAARGNDKNNDQYILLSYRLEFYIPNNKGPIFRKPSAYQ